MKRQSGLSLVLAFVLTLAMIPGAAFGAAGGASSSGETLADFIDAHGESSADGLTLFDIASKDNYS